jgi:hypothetical protein
MNRSSQSWTSSRAYIAHERVVTAARMYIQMSVIGLLLATILYGGGMGLFLSYYFDDPANEIFAKR